MDSEKEIIIAFIFKRSGKKQISFSEFYLTLSIELNWFTPEDSKKLTQQMIQSGLLTKENENVTPGFDLSNIKIPSGFFPTKDILKEGKIEKTTEKDILTPLIGKIVEKSKKDQKKVLEEVKKISEERNITIEVATLVFGKDFDIVFDDLYEKVEEQILAA